MAHCKIGSATAWWVAREGPQDPEPQPVDLAALEAWLHKRIEIRKEKALDACLSWRERRRREGLLWDVVSECEVDERTLTFLAPALLPEGDLRWVAERVLRLMALKYARDPGYDEGWRIDV